jgi:hypothetical protein
MPARARRTLAEMIQGGFQSFGPDYSLWNRRSRCKLTKGCKGWNKFAVGPGYPAKDYDDRTEMRWFDLEWDERHAGDG